jgi:hypothetical protein
MGVSSNTEDEKPGQGKGTPGAADPMRDAGKGIDAPRLTPQGRESDDAAGEDETDPFGGAKTGQPSKAEG